MLAFYVFPTGLRRDFPCKFAAITSVYEMDWGVSTSWHDFMHEKRKKASFDRAQIAMRNWCFQRQGSISAECWSTYYFQALFQLP
jgi:hypothetical protein